MGEVAGAAAPKAAVLVSAGAEWRVVKKYFPTAEQQMSPLGGWFIQKIQSGEKTLPVLFFHGGWGKIAAAASTQYVIDRWKPEMLINLGTCGGFAGEIEAGTILLAERTLVYDILEQMGDPDLAIAHYASEIDLSWLPDPYPQEVRRALLVSADRDLVVGEIPGLKERYGAVAGDWESGAIAYVARRNQVRLLILRGVSDLVGADGGEAYDGNKQVFLEGTARVMNCLLDALPGWLRGSTEAEKH